jgi:hypothetical protein
MTDEQYKKIMTDLGQPDSITLLAALRQVANETTQELEVKRRARVLCGDYFTHDRTGARFVCNAATHCDYRTRPSTVRVEIELKS